MCNNRKIKGVLWDLDGVIVDSLECHLLSMQQALLAYGFSAKDEELTQLFGTNTEKIIASVLMEKSTPQWIDTLKERHSDQFCRNVRGHVKAFPGVISLLTMFSQLGLLQAIASSSTLDIIYLVLEELGIRNYFQSIQSGADLPPKPDPAVFIQAALSLGLKPEECLVIEDSPMGVVAAKVAGMKCLAVTTSNPETVLNGADIIIKGLDTIVDLNLLF